MNDKVNEINDRINDFVSLDGGIVSESSNKLTRFVSHMKAPFQFDKKNKWNKLKVLRFSADLVDSLKDIQEDILSNDVDEALSEATTLYHTFESIVNIISRDNRSSKREKGTDELLREPQEEAVVDAESLDQPDQPEERLSPTALDYYLKDMTNDLKELKSYLSSEDIKDHKESIDYLTKHLNIAKATRRNDFYAAERQVKYLLSIFGDFKRNILNGANAANYSRYNDTSYESVRDVENTYEDEDAYEEKFEKSANRFTNYLKRNKKKYFEEESTINEYTLRADAVINELKGKINHFMNNLESSAELNTLWDDVLSISEDFSSLYKELYYLGDSSKLEGMESDRDFNKSLSRMKKNFNDFKKLSKDIKSKKGANG